MPDIEPGTLVEGVVGAKQKSNWLRHLAPFSGEPVWATRSVRALCGWTGFAMGCSLDDRTGAYDRWGRPVFRRSCARCEAIAKRLEVGYLDA